MVTVIPTSVKNAWDKWNIRGIILFSLSLQALLILISPFRKTTSRSFLTAILWSGYLLADWAATYGVGLISDGRPDGSHPSSTPENSDLLAFWAPFLLLHLGGPDTITALALEDNELWLRHMLSLISQAVAALYVFAQTLPNNKLWIPTTLLFIAGIIKYVERTRALFLASLDGVRGSMAKEPDPGVDYDKVMEDYTSKIEARVPTQIVYVTEPDRPKVLPKNPSKLSGVQVVQVAYHFFNTFKGLVVDIMLGFHEYIESRNFFQQMNAETAVEVMEVELNFIYEVMFTKVQVIQSKIGYVFRALAFGATLASLGFFYYRVPKTGFNIFDVRVTYTLLLGAIALDIISLFMLIFSDWTVKKLVGEEFEDEFKRLYSWKKKKKKHPWSSVSSFFLEWRRPYWRASRCQQDSAHQHFVLATPFLFRKWSGRVFGHNLIRYCLKGRPQSLHEFTGWTNVSIQKIKTLLGVTLFSKFVGESKISMHKIGAFLNPDPLREFAKKASVNVQIFMTQRWWTAWVWILASLILYIVTIPSNLLHLLQMGLQDTIDYFRYVSSDRLTKELWTFIFNELKQKSYCVNDPETAKRVSSARGDWILMEADTGLPENHWKELMRYVTEVRYDESLLMWHVATELCYNDDKGNDDLGTVPKLSQKTNAEEKLAVEKKESDKDAPTYEEIIRSFKNHDYREFSKMLSDYMVYLLVMQPTMMSAVAGIGKIRFGDTCAEAERFFKRRNLKAEDQEEACFQILKVNTSIEPMDVKGDSCKSVLFDGCILAKKLIAMENKTGVSKWKLLSRIWVELMSYAANHCRPNTHAQHLSKGGELITFVWLLMAHLGLREEFLTNGRRGRVKFVVGM